jgi:immunoglobulin-binding protein 1
MSIDEYLSREMARGNFLTGGGKKSEDNGVKLDLEDEDDSEAALTRKREWDAFKDDNVRGAGNRYNKG